MHVRPEREYRVARCSGRSVRSRSPGELPGPDCPPRLVRRHHGYSGKLRGGQAREEPENHQLQVVRSEPLLPRYCHSARTHRADCRRNQTLADDGTCSVTTHTTEAACTTAGATWTADGDTDPCQPYLEQEWGCQCSEFPAVLAANPDAECVPSENDPQGGIAVIYYFSLLLCC